MPLTIAAVEQALIVRCGSRMLMVGFPNIPSTSLVPNIYTLDSINWAAELTNIPVATYGSPTDLDLSAVVGNLQTRVFVDLAELRLTETIMGNWSYANPTSESVQSRSISYGDHLKALQDRSEQLRKDYAAYLVSVPVGASIGAMRHIPITATPPNFRPGAGRWNYGRYGPTGGSYGGGHGGCR